MLTRKTPPQPRFRIWDRVVYKGSGSPIEQTVIGINWDDYHKDYEVAFAPLPQNVDSQFAMDSDPNLRLVSRPGLEPQTPAESPQQKADRLKQEFEQCDDKGWLGKMVEWEKAEKDIKREPASPSANTIGSVSGPTGTFDPATVTLDLLGMHRRLREVEDHLLAIDQRIAALHRQVTPYGPKRNPFDQWVRPVVIGTNSAPDNKDG